MQVPSKTPNNMNRFDELKQRKINSIYQKAGLKVDHPISRGFGERLNETQIHEVDLTRQNLKVTNDKTANEMMKPIRESSTNNIMLRRKHVPVALVTESKRSNTHMFLNETKDEQNQDLQLP